MSYDLTALYERLRHDDELQDEVNSYKAEQRELASQMMIERNKTNGD